MERCQSKGTKFCSCKMNKSRDLMYGMTTTVYNIVLNTGNSRRQQITDTSHQTQKNGNCEETIVNQFVEIISYMCDTYMYQIIISHNLEYYVILF